MGKMSFEQYNSALEELNKELIGIYESKEYKMGQKLLKLKYSIKHFKPKQILIGIKHQKIVKKLMKKHKENELFITYNDQITTDSRIAVYTCITGGYDGLLEPLIKPENVDYYVVTDMEIKPDSKWKKIDINNYSQLAEYDNTRKARYVKTHPHIFFEGYEFSIWVDSNFRIISDLTKFIKNIGENVPFASHWHPYRNSIYDELEACVLRNKDNKELMEEQIFQYKQEGMPDNFGLIETNFIVRKHMNFKCIELMENWWNNILKWSKRDQLSLPYVIWKSGYTMHDLGFIGRNVRENYSVQILLHKNSYKGRYE